MYAVTAATGQLGRLVIAALLRRVSPDRIVAAVRTPSKATDLRDLGVEVREGDYDRPDTLASAFRGVERVLLISSDAVGSRVAQHQSAIDASRQAGVTLLAYTSILHADTTPAKLALDHRQTEAAIASSGIPAAILRNGWYTENKLMSLDVAWQHGAIVGASGAGRFSFAARADYAEAAAAVLAGENQGGKVYELAGDEGVTMAAFASEISRQAGRPLSYADLPEADYKAILLGAGLPDMIADVIADADAVASRDTLFDDGRALSRLIGRPTTPVGQSIAAALGGAR